MESTEKYFRKNNQDVHVMYFDNWQENSLFILKPYRLKLCASVSPIKKTVVNVY